MSRIILIKCLSYKKKKCMKFIHFKIFLLKFLRNMLHANVDIFDFLEIIIDSLTDDNIVIREFTLKLFDEYLSSKSDTKK